MHAEANPFDCAAQADNTAELPATQAWPYQSDRAGARAVGVHAAAGHTDSPSLLPRHALSRSIREPVALPASTPPTSNTDDLPGHRRARRRQRANRPAGYVSRSRSRSRSRGPPKATASPPAPVPADDEPLPLRPRRLSWAQLLARVPVCPCAAQVINSPAPPRTPPTTGAQRPPTPTPLADPTCPVVQSRSRSRRLLCAPPRGAAYRAPCPRRPALLTPSSANPQLPA